MFHNQSLRDVEQILELFEVSVSVYVQLLIVILFDIKNPQISTLFFFKSSIGSSFLQDSTFVAGS